ncbi:MAG: T9SS type A sorting domain-containing protein [Bacteroidetes bacterium]|nr:T9SS type A sorting domain-containing protein [Bacteroidota bacterium]
MKKLILISTAVLALTVVHGQTTFQKTYNHIYEYQNLGTIEATVRETSDSGFIMIGVQMDTLDTLSTVSQPIYVIKTDKNGDTLWTKVFNIGGGACNIIQTSDSGYALCGRYFIKLNSQGDTLWSKYISNGFLTDIKQTSDGGYILTGYGGSNDDFILTKSDGIGNIQWTKLYGGTGVNVPDRAFAVYETTSGYLAIGFTGNWGDALFVVKVDFNGNLLWTKTYKGSGNRIAWNTTKTSDGGYVLAGWAGEILNDNIYFLKIDSDGNFIWDKEFDIGLYDNMRYISETFDKGFIMCGGNTLLKTDSVGNFLWAKKVNANGRLDCVQQTMDSSFAILALTWDTINSGLTLIKTDNLGNSCFQSNLNYNNVTTTTQIVYPTIQSLPSNIAVTSIHPSIHTWGTVIPICSSTTFISEIPDNNYFISVFPNPFSTQTVLQTDNLLHNATLTVDNCFGQTVVQIKNISGQTVVFSRDNLASGLYFVRLTENNKIFTDKLIITDR